MLFANNKFLTSFDSLCYFEEFSVNWWSNNRNVNSRQTSVLTDLEIGLFSSLHLPVTPFAKCSHTGSSFINLANIENVNAKDLFIEDCE